MTFFGYLKKVLFHRYGKADYEKVYPPEIAKRRRANRKANKQAAASRRINKLKNS